jgi:hypothetical protein
MLFMVADGNRRGIRHLLPDFWEQATDHGLALPGDKPVSASAICQARGRLHADLFRDLLYALSSAQPGEVGQAQRWRGRRVFAADGAKINLRRAPDLEYSFGVPAGAHCPQVLMRQPTVGAASAAIMQLCRKDTALLVGFDQGGSLDGGRLEFEEFCPSRASSRANLLSNAASRFVKARQPGQLGLGAASLIVISHRSVPILPGQELTS